MLKGTKTSKKKKNHHSKRQLYMGQRLSEDKTNDTKYQKEKQEKEVDEAGERETTCIQEKVSSI